MHPCVTRHECHVEQIGLHYSPSKAKGVNTFYGKDGQLTLSDYVLSCINVLESLHRIW